MTTVDIFRFVANSSLLHQATALDETMEMALESSSRLQPAAQAQLPFDLALAGDR
jgi:glycine cleavage system pyridoxal-binding protein P